MPAAGGGEVVVEDAEDVAVRLRLGAQAHRLAERVRRAGEIETAEDDGPVALRPLDLLAEREQGVDIAAGGREVQRRDDLRRAVGRVEGLAVEPVRLLGPARRARFSARWTTFGGPSGARPGRGGAGGGSRSTSRRGPARPAGSGGVVSRRPGVRTARPACWSPRSREEGKEVLGRPARPSGLAPPRLSAGCAASWVAS